MLLTPRRIAILIPPTVVDLAGNSITPEGGGGTQSFVPERLRFEPIDFIEEFRNNDMEDTDRSGAAWGEGRLARSTGGGSGRLGVLTVRNGQTIELDTDSQDFPLQDGGLDLLGNREDEDPMDPKAEWELFPRTYTVEDGIFEFGRIFIEAGGKLSLKGDFHARLFSRGRLIVQDGGLIDASGTSPIPHRGSVAKPRESGFCDDGASLTEADCEAAGGVWTFSELGAGGPNGGDGGFGGDRYDTHCWEFPETNCQLNQIGAISNPGAEVDGKPGQGVGRAMTPAMGEGGGGISFPANLPVTADASMDSGDLAWGSVECTVGQVGGSGAGGAYAGDGTDGLHQSSFADSHCPSGEDLAPPMSTPAGLTAEVGLNPPDPTYENGGYTARLLDPHDNLLRGGAGGGGGGMHPSA